MRSILILILVVLLVLSMMSYPSDNILFNVFDLIVKTQVPISFHNGCQSETNSYVRYALATHRYAFPTHLLRNVKFIIGINVLCTW